MDVFFCCRSQCSILNFAQVNGTTYCNSIVYYCYLCLLQGGSISEDGQFCFLPKKCDFSPFPPILRTGWFVFVANLLHIFFLRSIFGKVLYCTCTYAHNKIRNSPRLSLRGWPPRRASLLRLPPLPPSHFSQKRTQLRQRRSQTAAKET